MAANLLNNSSNPSRKYASVADYKITWVRPEKVSNLSFEKSGDQGLKVDVKSSDFGKLYNELPELNK